MAARFVRTVRHQKKAGTDVAVTRRPNGEGYVSRAAKQETRQYPRSWENAYHRFGVNASGKMQANPQKEPRGWTRMIRYSGGSGSPGARPNDAVWVHPSVLGQGNRMPGSHGKSSKEERVGLEGRYQHRLVYPTRNVFVFVTPVFLNAASFLQGTHLLDSTSTQTHLSEPPGVAGPPTSLPSRLDAATMIGCIHSLDGREGRSWTKKICMVNC